MCRWAGVLGEGPEEPAAEFLQGICQQIEDREGRSLRGSWEEGPHPVKTRPGGTSWAQRETERTWDLSLGPLHGCPGQNHLLAPRSEISSGGPQVPTAALEGPGLGGHCSSRLQARKGAKSLTEEAGDRVPILPRLQDKTPQISQVPSSGVNEPQ